MKANFNLTFDERDDKVKTWRAQCRDCDATLVGERYPPVTVLQASPEVSTSQFEQLKVVAAAAWKHARETGNPVVSMDRMFEVISTHDHGDLQRALEAHADSCPAMSERSRPEPTLMPGPGEPRR